MSEEHECPVCGCECLNNFASEDLRSRLLSVEMEKERIRFAWKKAENTLLSDVQSESELERVIGDAIEIMNKELAAPSDPSLLLAVVEAAKLVTDNVLPLTGEDMPKPIEWQDLEEALAALEASRK